MQVELVYVTLGWKSLVVLRSAKSSMVAFFSTVRYSSRHRASTVPFLYCIYGRQAALCFVVRHDVLSCFLDVFLGRLKPVTIAWLYVHVCLVRRWASSSWTCTATSSRCTILSRWKRSRTPTSTSTYGTRRISGTCSPTGSRSVLYCLAVMSFRVMG